MVEYLNDYDFYAEWESRLISPECGMAVIAITSASSMTDMILSYHLEQLSDNIDIPVAILEIDVEDCEHLMEYFEITEVPCVFVYAYGTEIARFDNNTNNDDIIQGIMDLYNERK